MQYKLVCFKPGDKDIFSVKIDETDIVDDLKQEIKKQLAPKLNAFVANDLVLYKTKVDISNDDEHKILEQISKGTYQFKLKLKLKSARKISSYFKRDSEETVEVLVEIPPGEPINFKCLWC
jgi:hypothetical protein